MNLGLDIMEAVRRGGSERWAVEYKKKPQREKKPSKIQEEYERKLSEILDLLGNQRLLAREVSKSLNISIDTAYHRLKSLEKSGRVKHSQKAPYTYWRIA